MDSTASTSAALERHARKLATSPDVLAAIDDLDRRIASGEPYGDACDPEEFTERIRTHFQR